MAGAPEGDGEAVLAALAALGKRRLALAIHDASFPGTPGEDPGRGTPYSRAALDFLAFVRRLGFDGVVLGPQGMPSRDNPSPYDGTLFSRNTLNIDFAALARDPEWEGLAGDAPPPLGACSLERAQHAAAYDAQARALDRLHARLRESRARGEARGGRVSRSLAAFRRASRGWLAADALYFALAERHRGAHHRDWPCAADRRLHRPPPGKAGAYRARARALARELAQPIERHVLGQLVVHRQHAAFRAAVNRLGLRLYADLQIGFSPCDEWRWGALFLDGYRLGAPPSRTNPAGQPWGYPVLDPSQYDAPGGGPGPAVCFLARRVEKLLDECDGLRIDHPHGLVCPWVYRPGDRDPGDPADPCGAVRVGARLFESPELPDHPALARYAIARPAQIDRGAPRHADGWVRRLDPDQVERYGRLLDVLVGAVRARGGAIDEVVCEVLSTCPYPLRRQLERHGLGRFRVTQKANVHDAADVYRSENAKPADWIMVGNHDTPPIWKLVRDWHADGTAGEQATYLARRLGREGRAAQALAAELAADPRRLAAAKLADVFASPAAHVLVFFSDLLGLQAAYNAPGTVSAENWSLRVPPDYGRRYARSCARGEALSLPRVLALALRARGGEAHRALLERLERMGGGEGTSGEGAR